ncbi:uncharacterized protein YkwD [Mobilisporobacter senegalensis]|uniref:Uncharacterized protein YkwD n=1 Tax=Mobilisporobacter senegalensis TaxID=1329262 RepID=A0A3N1XW52_9FIRM|nr:CAP domain-containing protein [Mobilisporobacter senegalensis]ROR30826.1 uncharacterized protein YkwD [Mobilisporobacter senegalensis]
MKKLTGKTGNSFNGKKLLIGAMATVLVATSAVGVSVYSETGTTTASAATVKLSNCNTTSGSKQATVNKITSASDIDSILKQYGINGNTKTIAKKCPTIKSAAVKSATTKKIAKKCATKKSTAKKSTAKKSKAKKSAAKKSTAKKNTAKKSTTKPSTTKPSTSTPSTTNGDYNANYANEVLTLVNQERSKAGLSPLKMNTAASNAAKVRAKEIVSKFDHTRPNGQSPFTALDAAGVSYRTAGENIAYGQQTPSAVMNGWMNSSGHRANILKSSFKEIGIGAYYQNGKYYWVQLFIG